MTRPADKRPTLTLKGEEFTPEFRSLLNKAAKRLGQTQAAFAAETLAEAARRVLSHANADNPPSNPAQLPAVIQSIEEAQKRQEATDKAIAELAEQVKALTEAQRKGLWFRLFGGTRS